MLDFTADDKNHVLPSRLTEMFRRQTEKKAAKALFLGVSPLALAACGGGTSDDNTSLGDENTSVSNATLRYVDLSDGDFVMIPTNISEINSFAQYTKPASSHEIFSFDPFDTSPEFVVYPEIWNGTFDLNFSPSGNLPSDVTRAIAIKDIISFDNPNWTSATQKSGNSTDNLHDAFDQIALNLKELGIEHTTITQWSWGAAQDDETFVILDPNTQFGPIKDSDLDYFVEAMNNVNIQVGMWSQIQAFVNDDGSTYLPDVTEENITNWYDAYGEFVAERAPIYQEFGITEWEISCDFCALGPMYDAIAGGNNRLLVLQETIDIIDLARTDFLGELTIQNNFEYIFQGSTIENEPYLNLETELLSKIDGVHTSLYTTEQTATKLDELSSINAGAEQVISMFKEEFSSAIFQIEQLAKFTDKIYVNVQLQSREDVFSNPGYLEETGKTSQIQTSETGFVAVNTNLEDAVQETTKVDFSIQAIYFEAAMQALAELDIDAEIIIIAGEYFVPAQLLPDETYPSLGTTIRNKPAEFVVDQWFSDEPSTLITQSDFLL